MKKGLWLVLGVGGMALSGFSIYKIITELQRALG